MKVDIRTDSELKAPYVEIYCREVTSEVKGLRRYIEDYGRGIKAVGEGRIEIVPLNRILYIESVDKKTFIYTADKVLNCDKRLYELEMVLDGRDFFRCSKAVIINLTKITRLKPEISRNILATLTNGEVVTVSRRYAGELKRLLGIGE